MCDLVKYCAVLDTGSAYQVVQLPEGVEDVMKESPCSKGGAAQNHALASLNLFWGGISPIYKKECKLTSFCGHITPACLLVLRVAVGSPVLHRCLI